MKFLAIILLFLVAFGSIESHKLRHRHKNSNKVPTFVSNLGAFVKGTIVAIVGGTGFVDALKGCLNYGDNDEAASKGTEASAVSANALDSKSNIDKFFGYLGKAVNFICLAKSVVEAFFLTSRRLFLRRQRMFNEATTEVGWWKWIDNIVDKTKALLDKISNVGNELFAKAKGVASKFSMLTAQGLNLATANAAAIATWTKAKLKSIFSVVGDWIDTSLKPKMKAFFASKPYDIFTNFVKCVVAGKVITNDGIKKFFLPYVVMPANVALLVALDPVTWVKFIVNLICGWETWKKAIDAFVKAWTSTGTTKWENYGTYAGLVATIAVGAYTF
jgi:hypothetical protein